MTAGGVLIKALGESSDVYESDNDSNYRMLTYLMDKLFFEFTLTDSEIIDEISVGYFDY